MTEQEASAFAARLTRIWEPVGELKWEFPAWQPEHISCFGEWTPGVELNYYWLRGTNSFVLDASKIHSFPDNHEDLVGRLQCFARSGQIESIFPSRHQGNENFRNLYHQFDAHYLAPFRRGCWLSGCPIEASAHEKIEWIQGFTLEEIESWHLEL